VASLAEAIECFRAVCEGSAGQRRLDRRHKAQVKQGDQAHRDSLAAHARKQSSSGPAWKQAHGELLDADKRSWQARLAANKTYDRLRYKIDQGATRAQDRKAGPRQQAKRGPKLRLKPGEKMVFGRVVKVA